MTSVEITREQAADALRAAASPAGTVHQLCFTARGEILSRHQEVEDAIDDLQYAEGGCIAFEPGPFGHNLAALMNGIIFRYRVPMPETRPGAEAFVAEHGRIVAEVLADAVENGYGDELAGLQVEEAHRALCDLLADDPEGP